MEEVQIRFKGHMDASWSEWLAGMVFSHTTEGETLLRGRVADQSALYGLLGRLSDLGIQLVSVSFFGKD